MHVFNNAYLPFSLDYVQSDFPLRLQGGSTPSEGRVEVMYNGEWGTICDDFWDLSDATVVCHELGYRQATRATTNGEFGSGTESQPIWLDDVACSGSEEHLSDCGSGGWGNHNCHHYEDAGVSCEGIHTVFIVYHTTAQCFFYELVFEIFIFSLVVHVVQIHV